MFRTSFLKTVSYQKQQQKEGEGVHKLVYFIRCILHGDVPQDVCPCVLPAIDMSFSSAEKLGYPRPPAHQASTNATKATQQLRDERCS
jgi:hypothetical protein